MSAAGWTLLLAACALCAARNEAPCQRSKWSGGHDTFVKRHVRAGLPASLDAVHEWRNYIKNNGGCDRPTQSFLEPRDLERVKAVCSSGGGRTFKENLCISREPFNFVTVRSEPGTCGIRNVLRESKHLILACELLDDRCLPVHFEGNPKSARPSDDAPGCRDPDSRGRAPGLRPTRLPLLAAALLVLCLL